MLLDVFLLDGHEQKTFVFVYLPLFLANSIANHDVNLLGGLKFLVEIYDRCILLFVNLSMFHMLFFIVFPHVQIICIQNLIFRFMAYLLVMKDMNVKLSQVVAASLFELSWSKRHGGSVIRGSGHERCRGYSHPARLVQTWRCSRAPTCSTGSTGRDHGT